MKKKLLFLSLLLLSIAGKAQSAYCLSVDDYYTKTWHAIENLQLEFRSGKKSLWNGGASFQPKSSDKKTDKILKKSALLILHHDSLYINCRSLSCQGVRFGNWYAPACAFERENILFTALSLKAIKQTSNSAVMFGIIGGAIAASKHKNEFMCYIYYPGANTVEPINQAFMNQLLEEHPALLEAYSQVEETDKEMPKTVLPILTEIGVINEWPNINNQ